MLSPYFLCWKVFRNVLKLKGKSNVNVNYFFYFHAELMSALHKCLYIVISSRHSTPTGILPLQASGIWPIY